MEVAYVRDAQLADVLVLSKTMRKADREEILASNGVSALTPLDANISSLSALRIVLDKTKTSASCASLTYATSTKFFSTFCDRNLQLQLA